MASYWRALRSASSMRPIVPGGPGHDPTEAVASYAVTERGRPGQCLADFRRTIAACSQVRAAGTGLRSAREQAFCARCHER